MTNTNLSQMPSAKEIELTGDIFEDCNRLIAHDEAFRQAALKREQELMAHNMEMRQLLQWFINRVENGEVRSKATYKAFCEVVDKLPAHSLAEIKAQAVEDAVSSINPNNESEDNVIRQLEAYANNLRGQADSSPDKYLAKIAADNPGLYMRHVTDDMIINYG